MSTDSSQASYPPPPDDFVPPQPMADPYGQSQSLYPQPAPASTYPDPMYVQQAPMPAPMHAPMPPVGFQYQKPEHPQATTVLVLGLAGLMFPLCSFVAWFMGAKAKNEIRMGAPYEWKGSIAIGYWTGVIVSVLSIAIVAMWIFMVLLLAIVLGAV
ncbi:hypothetical protein [Tessaracoccus sp. OH4464_COT-324]|uniref:hypothetical protein n=1 Tax=Tessaracoccus sp. OH4464_COT-324 TaxID=2491059 RepID=UPI000F63B84B|nr:hypothetical protein [Tessaracoccus sp. OH4464_COT-324]RRD46109.1 hypothetical protein EII42_08580 [Tessaracoccus sp. OH4464_COT-324]